MKTWAVKPPESADYSPMKSIWKAPRSPEFYGSGMLSRRLQNASKKWVDFRGFLRMRVESTSSGKHRRINALASEVARHQQFRKSADLSFNSRRLHHSTRLAARLRRAAGSLMAGLPNQSNVLSK